MLVVQQRRHGYAWDREQQVFVRLDTSPLASAGSGYAVMQLLWPGEGVLLAPWPPPGPATATHGSSGSGSGAVGTAGRGSSGWLGEELGGGATGWQGGHGEVAAGVQEQRLSVSVLDYLASRGVEWLLTRVRTGGTETDGVWRGVGGNLDDLGDG